MGRAPQPDGHLHAVAGTLERLLRAGGTYVKLSSFYETKRVRLADYGPLAIHLASIAPDRLLWGSDWNHQKDIKVDDARVFDQLAIWVPDETVRNKILVSNPDALYWRD